ncbi:MAG: hypothetical protein K6F03_04085 [Saccharofermentans sp.]|nr:hypothetical protein [Saccharofermentans sp.]
MENAIWKCSCGQDNDGNFCINCGATKPAVTADTVGAPAPAAVAPVETAAPAAVAPAVAPIEPAPAAVEPAQPVAPAVAPVAEAAPEQPAPAVAPVVAPVAAAAAVAAVSPEEEPVQVIKCQPMPETPMEDYSNVPSDPEFADAENVPAQPVYQPAPVAAPVEPVQSAYPEAPKQVGSVNYQNTSSNPYSEPDRASHNPYAPAPVAQPQPTYGYAAPAPTNSGVGLLILGIAAIVLAFDVTIGAIICGAIGCSMAKKLKGPDGQYPTGKAKVGAILSKVGLIIGIVTTIIAIIWIIIWIVAIIAGAGYAMSH